MATARAIANGNWSSTSTWNGGVLPGNGDTVYANGFNVTLDVDVNIGGANNPTVNTGSLVSGQWYEIVNVGGQTWTTLGASSNTVGTVFQSTGTGTAGNLGIARALATLTTATNTAAGATIGGGGFTMSVTRNMTCDLRSGSTTCLTVSGSANLVTSQIRFISSSVNALALNSSGIHTFSAPFIQAGAAAAISLSSGTTTMTGASIFASGTSGANGINNSATLTLISSFFGGGSNAGGTHGVVNSGQLTLTNCVVWGGSAAPCAGILNANNLFVTGSTLTASGGPALINQGTASVTITTSDFAASSANSAIIGINTSAIVNLSGNFFDHWQGFPAVYVAKYKLNTVPTLGQHRFALAGTTDSFYTMYGADNGAFGNPIAANVRSGIVYGGGNLTGTCAVPAAGSVALGVPVDATTGTAVLTPEAVWGHASRTITEGGITAADVWSAASRTITGGTVDTLTNAPSVPTAAAIATQVRSELSVELGRVDAAISSRLAGSAYTAPANSDISAIKSKTDNLPSDPADQSLLEAAIAGVTAPAASTVAAAVRSELSVELARVDQAVSSRLAASEASKLDAVKAKTDLLQTDRLAQCSTVATTGAQLAAALS